MAATSIINVEVNDGAWQKFNDSIAKHRVELAKMPSQWGGVGKAVGASSNAAAKFTARIMNASQEFQKANGAAGKMAVAIKSVDRISSSLVRNTFSVAKNLANATKSLMSWTALTGLFSGLLGAGGLFGLTRMAGDVSAGQSHAKRVGASYGETKAASNVYGQLLGGEGGVVSTLSRIQDAMQNFGRSASGKPIFQAVGMKDEDWKGKSSVEVLQKYLEALKSEYQTREKAVGKEGIGAAAQSLGMTEILDMPELRELSKTNLTSLQNQLASVQKQLELSMSTQDAWSNFARKMSAAGEQIENMFVKKLVGLASPLGRLSDALVKATGTVLNKIFTKENVNKVAKGIESAANYLTSEQFSKDFQSFLDTMVKIGDAIGATADFIVSTAGTAKQFGNVVAHPLEATGRAWETTKKAVRDFSGDVLAQDKKDFMAEKARAAGQYSSKSEHTSPNSRNEKLSVTARSDITMHVYMPTGTDVAVQANGALNTVRH